MRRPKLLSVAAVGILTLLGLGLAATGPLWAQRPPTDRHVRELARYLDTVRIAEPMAYRHLAVYPLLADDEVKLRGAWLTLDAAIARAVLVIREKGTPSVPVVTAENRSRDQYVFLMAGEVLAGGKQTRTLRQDVALAPGQQVDLDVFCVEAHRWSGGEKFEAGQMMVPQSIQQDLRSGAGQTEVWDRVARSNQALQAENTTGSLELAIRSKPVQEKLEAVRRGIVPNVPAGTTGFLFVSRGRAVGAEMFGSEALARALFPKVLDSYAVDHVLLDEQGRGNAPADNRAAIVFFERICRTGSDRTKTPGSGEGFGTRAGGLLGDGLGLDGRLIHYGVQRGAQILPPPKQPPIIWPQPR